MYSDFQRQTVRRHESMSEGFESLERLTSLGESVNNLNEESMNELYSRYIYTRKECMDKLAINGYKQKILKSIETWEALVIEGPTGCGKTTQVPQWILDFSVTHRKPCKIVVTQPRRIAAISIAKRVAQERGWDVGGLVGYQIQRITYKCTCMYFNCSSNVRVPSVCQYAHKLAFLAANSLHNAPHYSLNERGKGRILMPIE